MGKYIFLLPSALFPYSLLFSIYCIFSGFLMKSIFDNNAFVLLFYLFAFFVIALIGDVIFLVLSIKQKWDSNRVSFINMIIKLLHIPAYILFFVLGILSFITIFTFGFSIVFFIFDCLAIFLTGLIGIASIVRCYADGKISKSFLIINSLFQFIFCFDIISSIIIFIKSKSNPT